MLHDYDSRSPEQDHLCLWTASEYNTIILCVASANSDAGSSMKTVSILYFRGRELLCSPCSRALGQESPQILLHS